MAPSPMAAAQRLTDPQRTSPAANTPGRLVSSGSGSRDSGQSLPGPRATSLPVTRYPAGVGDQPDPRGAVGAGGAADADEQGIRRQPYRFGAVPGAHDDSPEAVIGLHPHHLRAHPHINILDRRHLVDEVVRHRRAEIMAADQQRDLPGVPGEPDDRLSRRVAAAHHDNT